MSEDAPRWPYLATRHHITQWADRIDAFSTLPVLVRRLIDQTNDQVVDLQMRTDEGVRLRGYDGFSRASRGTPFVPMGPAVWEMGTDQRPEPKATDDYDKRTDEPLGVDPAVTTFVFVTPRSWPGKDEWVKARREEGIWFDVVAYDADDIDLAFERAPAAHIWFSELVGLPAQGAQSLSEWWTRFSQLSSPALTPAMVLAGRADEAAELLRILESDAQVTTISAASTDELLAFVAAVVLSIPDQERVRSLDSRSIAVKDAFTLWRLEHAPDSLVLVPYHDDLGREARLIRSHHVVIRGPVGGGTPTLDLPEIDPRALRPLLVAAGVPDRQADKLSVLFRRSIFAFQRAAPSLDLTAPPSWAVDPLSRCARRAWLVGGWNERRSGDTDAVAAFVGMPYSEARDELDGLAAGPDSLLTRVGESWTVTSMQDAWSYCHSRLDASDLAAFEVLVQSVLGVVDPRLELPVEERWAAGIYGKSPVHSSELRSGVADTLALIGANGGEVSIGSGPIQSWLHGALHMLLARSNEDSTGHLWASLSDVLPLVAEAAPDVFLRAVSDGLDGSEPILRTIFTDREDLGSFSVSSPHTGFLWALEGLAWSSEHFGEVVEVLARLVDVDPGGKLSNRPIASLVALFRPWFPQTSVSAQRRLGTIDTMRRRHQSVSWELLLSMLPGRHGAAMHTHRPKFREWPSEPIGVTHAELRDMYVAVAERAVEDAAIAPSRWIDLVTHLDDFPLPVLPDAVSSLRQSISESSGDSSDVWTKVWTSLHELVRKHRRYSEADWAMDTERLSILDELQEEMAPSDAVELRRWVFEQSLYLDAGTGVDFDYDDHMAAVSRTRQEAVAQVNTDAGPSGILRLARAVELPWNVGYAVGEVELTEAGEQLFDAIDSADQLSVAAQGWTAQRSQTLGWSWTEERVEMLSGRPLAQARILALQRDHLERAWDLLAELPESVAKEYWSEFSPYGLGPDFALAGRAASEMLAHGKPESALVLINMYLESEQVDSGIVVEALELLLETDAAKSEPLAVSSRDIERLLRYLQDSRADEDRLAVLEWRLRPALPLRSNSPVLERRLARDPAFFVEVLSLAFKSKSGVSESEGHPQLATNAYRLLSDWGVVPGSVQDGASVDPDQLVPWVDEVQSLLRQADRETIGMEMIGRVLAKAPADPDGTWPTLAVRELVEDMRDTALEDGFRVQLFNSRGVTSRSPAAGGDQERALAASFIARADRISDQWPRTASILRSLAASYEYEGQRHDEDAEKFLGGIDR